MNALHGMLKSLRLFVLPLLHDRNLLGESPWLLSICRIHRSAPNPMRHSVCVGGHLDVWDTKFIFYNLVT